jgi:phosphoribosylamine--glycine ligase
MKCLVIGGGGREHALAYFMKKSPLVDRLFCIPGNAGTREVAEAPDLPEADVPTLLRFAKREKIDFTVVGPEAPLVEGVSDLFRENGLAVFGPGADGARIEGSKIFAKRIMRDKGIPTAGFVQFSDTASALRHVGNNPPPFVIKADGLAAGKGVVIARTSEEARRSLEDMLDRRIFGESGTRVVVEQLLLGEEATVLALCDGKWLLPLVSSQDHKPVYDGDRGPNTGGMGAIAPAPVVNDEVMGRVMDRILLPLLDGLNERNISYRGVIYAGLMIGENGDPSVVEFNCRFGDPEAEVVLPLLESDLCELMLLAANGRLREGNTRWKNGYCCDVVIASGGYPGPYEKGKPISGLGPAEDGQGCLVFHAGTKLSNGRVVTNGGRVLNVVGTGATLRKAIGAAYRAVDGIRFDGMHFRTDIGRRGLAHLERGE